MVTTSAAARVNVRDVLRIKTIESYLRNFAGESHRLQEVLEITLSYGIYCISRNFLLKGMTVEELRTVTKYDQTKNQDYYVRNAAKPRQPEPVTSDPQQLFVKAPHSWRDGDRQTEVLSKETNKTLSLQTSKDANEPEVFFLPNEAHKDKLDEIDFYTRVLGKAFVDLAWATYSSRGSTYLDADQLQNRMTHVDQRKRPDLIPPTDYPVCSFVEFLNAYVKASVGKIVSYEQHENEYPVDEGAENSTPADTLAPRRGSHKVESPRAFADARPTIQTPTPKARTVPASRTPCGGGGDMPTSLRNVQSKIKPELRAHKEKLLRVKKTQTQLMKESLARTRLAEYAARQDDRAKSPLPIRRMPLDKITPGAAALEIVDDFIRSPLMDTFSTELRTASKQASQSARCDPLKEELYGTAAHDDSFLGCKAPIAQPRSSARKTTRSKPQRDYRGWLGDFGPQHTKTVRPVWDTDATTAGPDVDAASDEEEHINGTSGRAAAGRFEWKFDVLSDPIDRSKGVSSKRQTEGGSRVRSLHDDADDDEDDSLSASNDWSAGQSDASDPVYRWLKSADQ